MHRILIFPLTAITCAVLAIRIFAFGSGPVRELPLSEFRDKLRGGWAGQMIGVSYGSIYEFQSLNRTIDGPLRPWKPEFISNSINQDDIYVEMTFLKTLDRFGPRATARQAGEDFRDSKYRLWHANMAGRENLKMGIWPPRSGHPRYNPHADDIDFQIEADLFGLVSPGMPTAAENLCDVFGSIMNYGDGLYGGRFVAGMYCQAFLEKEATPQSVRRCLEVGLASIPRESRYAKTIRDVISGYEQNPNDWKKTWDLIQTKWGDQDLCPEGYKRPFNIDAKINGAYIALGLLYGGADFEKTLEITTRCGQDADCNPSNAAGVLGTLYGYSRIPKTFTDGIPALTGRKFEYTDYDFPQLIEACEQLTRRLLLENGGRIRGEVMILPAQNPRAPRKMEQVEDFPKEQILKWSHEFDVRRLQAIAPKGWNGGWMIRETGPEMDPGIRRILGRDSALITHPVSREAPAVLERRVRIPKSSPRLVLDVSSFTSEPTADWELLVKVDNAVLYREVVNSPGRWKTVQVDLAPYAGSTVNIRLENAAGGRNSWSWEAAYWGRAEILGD